jgi:hypothetical protein
MNCVTNQKSIFNLTDLMTKLAFLFIVMGLVECRDCACDCPNGCRVFSTIFGSVSDGSGSACIKESFGVTGQYGPLFDIFF